MSQIQPKERPWENFPIEPEKGASKSPAISPQEADMPIAMIQKTLTSE
jgi:hypothetical protein